MNRLVDWGHWVVAALFAIYAVVNLKFTVLRALHAQHVLEGLMPNIGMSPNALPIAGILFLACAWGILKWRTWAHTLAIVLCALNLFVLLFGSYGMHRPVEILSISLSFAATLAWLVLPSVRARFAKVI